jgi:outer membrane protein assembly factor BamB
MKIQFYILLVIGILSCSKDDPNAGVGSSFLSHTADENNSSSINIGVDFNNITISESWVNNELDYNTRHGALIDGDFIYTSLADGLAKLKRSNGEVVWSVDLEGAVKGSIALEGEVVFASADEYFYAIDKNTGEDLWGKDITHPIEATPAIHNGNVIISDITKGVYSFAINSGKQNWFYPITNGSSGTFLIHKNKLFIGDNDGAIHSIDPTNGQEIWIFSQTCTDPFSCPSIQTSLVMSQDKIFFGNDAGIMFSLSLDGKLLWQYKHSERVYYESAAISGNNIVMAGKVGGFGDRVAIVSVDASNGSFKYLKDVGKTWISNPLIINGSNILVGSSLGLNNISLSNGQIIWTYSDYNCDSQLAITNNDIVYNTINRKLVRLIYN